MPVSLARRPVPAPPAGAGNTSEAAVRRIREDFGVFQSYVGIAEEFLNASRLDSAAACAGIAAASAWKNHAGLFASGRLEDVITAVGRRAVPGATETRPVSRKGSPNHVLHVLSMARPMGGDSRFAARWMQADGTRRHSLAITAQGGNPIPEIFTESTARSGGRVYSLDADTNDPIRRARSLRALVDTVDLVVLHIFPDDIVPVLALADTRGRPPVAFINHSDHTFWIGGSVSDLVVQLRGCSVPLTLRRRHIEPERLATLPIPLPAAERTMSRAEARAQLGVKPDAVVLLSVGTAFKYKPVAGPGFLEVLRPIIEQHDQAVLLAVGPAPEGDWYDAFESTQGRIVALGRRFDTATLFQAADIYLDSFPFTSPTAALEAGTFGLPLVAYCPRTGDGRVLGPGAPGLDESMCRLSDLEAYSATVSALIKDLPRCRELGQRARQIIESHHTGAQWVERLEETYKLAGTMRPRSGPLHADECEVDELDVVVGGLYRVGHDGFGGFIDRHVRPFPFFTRLAILRQVLKVNRWFSLDLVLPGHLSTRILWRPPGWTKMRRMIAHAR